MPIAFTDKDWSRVTDNWTRWWAGALDRPIACAQLIGARDPQRPTSAGPLLEQSNCLDFSIPAEAIIDRVDYELSIHEFKGDSFPFFALTSFGPGTGAPLMGGTMDNSSGRVWFGKPIGEPPIGEIQVEANFDHPVLLRMTELIRAAQHRWGDRVMIGYPDIGGVSDIMASLVGSEELLLALYDDPDEVLRLREDVTQCWWQLMEYFHDVIADSSPGFSSWLNYYSSKMTYTTQSDFSYMVSPDMYARFIHPELAQTWNRLPRAVYHLDGKGELPHLPLMLSAPGLDAIQWVPGDGSPDETHWPDVYQTIAKAGKKIICNSLFALPAIIEQTGCPRQIAASNNNAFHKEEWDKAMAVLRMYDIE